MSAWELPLRIAPIWANQAIDRRREKRRSADMTIDYHMQDPSKQPLNEKLKQIYDALPGELKTRFRFGDALKSYETFVDCYWNLMNRAKQHPKIKISENKGTEVWLILGGYDETTREHESVLSLEMLAPRKCGDYGVLMEQVMHLFSRDILNLNHPSAAHHFKMFCQQ